ncbi:MULTISPECIES: hypothetical protein [Olivibacter]|uniref:Uncharacterized protein n=1 Tax=Olivibacter oleidegradans TaxID=760123 RepID=A0ABV6HL56_9SPHI|nr:hypothetical protein [Olivibacter jilunii]
MEHLTCDQNVALSGDSVIDHFGQIRTIKQYFDALYGKIRHVLEGSDTENLHNCIYHYQLDITSLLEKTGLLIKTIDEGKLPLKARKKYRYVLWVVIKRSFRFIELIKSRYPDYFDRNMAIPQILYPFYMTKILKRWFNIKKSLQHNKIDPGLIDVLNGFFNVGKNGVMDRKMTWQDLSYLDIVSSEVSWITDKGKTVEYRQDILQNLFRLNFNHPSFFSYYVRYMHNQIQGVDTYLQERREWLDYRRNLSAFIVCRDICYDDSMKDIRTQLMEYVIEQIRYVKKKEKLHRSTIFGKLGRAVYPYYFHVSLTVSQLIFLFRLFTETGVVIVRHRKDLNEFLVNHVGTTRKDNISIGSIRSKYTRPDKDVVNKVSAVLISMLNLLNAKYKTK